jgi:hypothetical protein
MFMNSWEPFDSEAIRADGWKRTSRLRAVFCGVREKGHPISTYMTGAVLPMGGQAIIVFADGLIRNGIINR